MTTPPDPSDGAPAEPPAASSTSGSAPLPGPAPSHDPYAALRYRNYRLYAAGALFWSMGQQMLAVAVGWQVFELTNSATALGLIGLSQALPVLGLAMHAGHVADRFNRKRIVLWMVGVVAACSLAMAVISDARVTMPGGPWVTATNHALLHTANLFGEHKVTFTSPVVPPLFLLLLVSGMAQAFGWPARAALLPRIVPLPVFNNAVTWNSSMFQVSAVAGPALGGGLIWLLHRTPIPYTAVYGLDALLAMVMAVCLGLIPYRHQEASGQALTGRALGAGIRFVWSQKLILATITLDMFAVLLGGATALLPMFAKDILKVGPIGLGALRAAPALGAGVMAVRLAHRAPMRRAGRAMLWAVTGFGVATIVFGFSTSFWLSMVMLALTGALDNVSVVVRHTLVQVLTPDEMRGRVSAVNNVFIGTSNELGALESGLTAAAFGPVASVVGGGIGTILVVLGVALIWPQIRRFGSLGDVGRGKAEAGGTAAESTT